MRKIIGSAFIVAALLLLGARAQAATLKEDVANARAQCRGDQQVLAGYERNSKWCTNDPQLIQARDAAERSCGRAMKLMIAAGMEPKIVSPQPAPPTPSITLVEHVRTSTPGPSQTTTEVASFAAMEADRRCQDTRK